jgi:hypothetical protein
MLHGYDDNAPRVTIMLSRHDDRSCVVAPAQAGAQCRSQPLSKQKRMRLWQTQISATLHLKPIPNRRIPVPREPTNRIQRFKIDPPIPIQAILHMHVPHLPKKQVA